MFRDAVNSMLSGYATHFAKPMLLGELRRILPTTVGLPMEISLITSAVTAASIEGKFHLDSLQVYKREKYIDIDMKNILFSCVLLLVQATVSPPLPVNYRVSQLVESDIQLRATVAPRYTTA